MTMENSIHCLHPDSLVEAFYELEVWNQTAMLENGVVRRIIAEELKNNPITNFQNAGIAFQLIFYRHLANKYIQQKTL